MVVDDPTSLHCEGLKKTKQIPPHGDNTSRCIFVFILHVSVPASLLPLGRKGK